MIYIFYILFIGFFILDFFLLHKRNNDIFNYFQIMFLLVGLSINSYFISHLSIQSSDKVELILLSIFFSLSSYFAYLNILAFISRSGSFLILIAYFQKKEKLINVDEIFKIKMRINELKKKNFIYKKDQKYILTNKGKIFLKLYLLFIHLFRIEVVG
ncbi:hypothetical protein VP91_00010130 [Candidatus Pelagibacter ubique]|uniref:Uncharacterized protein n=2 Tax=Pelagibacter ubique TaxID=198252 RepID=A0ABX1T320_PELUQ|nr:hypothetical protein [Candidatus Pelagibacter ubique]